MQETLNQKLTGLQLYRHIIAKYSANFEANRTPSFTDLIWQLVVNKAYGENKTHCFVPVLPADNRPGFIIGIAEHNEAGCYDTGVYLTANIDYLTAYNICEQINLDLFGLPPNISNDIITYSMLN